MAAEWQNTIHPRKVQQCEHTLLVLELVNLDISMQPLPNIILCAGSLKLKLFPFLPYPATVLPRADWGWILSWYFAWLPTSSFKICTDERY